MELQVAAAKLALGKLTSEQARHAASLALDRGIHTESLGETMFREPIWSEIGPLFERALSELGIAVPSRAEAMLVIAREYAQAIVAGTISPYEGARRIWWEVTLEPGVDSSLRVFTGLASEWEDDLQHRAQYEAEILAEARRLLSKAWSS